jgi:hypothetical protein
MIVMCQPQPAPRQRRYLQVVEYCRREHAATGKVPSYSMIRDALHISHDGNVRRYVRQAADAGLISLAPTTGGRGPRRGERIRLGTPEEAAEGRKTILMGRDLPAGG